MYNIKNLNKWLVLHDLTIKRFWNIVIFIIDEILDKEGVDNE